MDNPGLDIAGPITTALIMGGLAYNVMLQEKRRQAKIEAEVLARLQLAQAQTAEQYEPFRIAPKVRPRQPFPWQTLGVAAVIVALALWSWNVQRTFNAVIGRITSVPTASPMPAP